MTESVDSNHLYRITDSQFYEHPAKIFSLDYYNRNAKGEDDFSRKQVWFHVYGDEDIEKEFRTRMSKLVNSHFPNNHWDIITIYPTHVKGEVNTHMEELVSKIAEDSEIDYGQILNRNQTIEENHELESLRKKIVNIEGTIDIDEDIEGKNILVVDNISLSGASLLHATNKLYDEGAANVASITLGLGQENKEDDMIIEKDAEAKKIMEKTKKEV